MNKLSVLIVDDSKDDRYILKRLLGELEIEITIVEKTDGEHAVAYMENFEENATNNPESFPPDIIFLDINMPLKSGFDFLAEFSEIHSRYGVQNTAVIMFTSSARQDDYENSHKYDFVKGFLVKGTFSTDDLNLAIEQAIAPRASSKTSP